MRGDCRLPKYLETERRFVLCTTAMKIQTDPVQTLADLLGFDAETTHELLIQLAAKTIRSKLDDGVHPLDALTLDDLPQVDHAPAAGPWSRLLNTPKEFS